MNEQLRTAIELDSYVIKLFTVLKWRRPFVLLARQHRTTCTKENN
jgi:hypothetical protein